MTRPDENRRPVSQPIKAAQDRLRAELLVSALYDLAPLAEVESLITRGDLIETLPARQEFALRTIRSLLEDGLMQIGDLPYPGKSSQAGTSRSTPPRSASMTSSSAIMTTANRGTSRSGWASRPPENDKPSSSKVTQRTDPSGAPAIPGRHARQLI